MRAGGFDLADYGVMEVDDKGYWNQVEPYIQEHSKAKFSHGICRECAEKYYPGYDLYEEEND